MALIKVLMIALALFLVVTVLKSITLLDVIIGGILVFTVFILFHKQPEKK